MQENILRLDILSSTVNEAGEIRVKLGDVQEDNLGAGDGAAIWCSGAFLSRPNDPDADGAAQALYLVDGNEKRVLGWYDGRYSSMAGQLAPGDCAIVTPDGARVFIKNATRTIALYSENNAGESQIMQIVGDGDGSFTVQVANSILHMGKNTIVLQTQDVQLALTPSGIQLNGKYIALNSLKGNVGLNPGGVAPVTPTQAIMHGPADPTGTAPTLSSLGWSVGIGSV